MARLSPGTAKLPDQMAERYCKARIRLAVVRGVCKVDRMSFILSRTIILLSLAISSGPSAAQAPVKTGVPREINITTDSAQGWLPSEELEWNVKATVDRYFAAVDGAKYRDAYEMMSDSNKAQLSYEQFELQSKRFQAQAGPLRRRDILKITWTKDPADAPYPGVYAAIDEAASFRDVDRQCGYIILYQRPAGGPFEVMRTETNFIDNASAATIARTQSPAELDRIWAALSANCPNFGPPSAR